MTNLSISSIVDPFHFQAGGHRRRPKLGLVFKSTLQNQPNKAGLKCLSVYMYVCMSVRMYIRMYVHPLVCPQKVSSISMKFACQ